jgi:hypothetical protein
MYNGYGAEQVTSGGAKKKAITAVKDRMVGRGVLLDLPRYKGEQWLDTSESISAEDREGCAKAENAEVFRCRSTCHSTHHRRTAAHNNRRRGLTDQLAGYLTSSHADAYEVQR